jgi:methionine-gamma-lyase
LGIEVTEVDATDPANIAAAMDERTQLVHIETPANPTLTLVDIEAVAAITKKWGVPLMVDNTFATPYLQQPLTLGADIVLHSATKYIGGHGDTVAGILVGTQEFIDVALGSSMRDLGPVISPFNSWLLLRGLKTLPVRMDKHCENAAEIAHYLEFHPAVERVLYPGLRTHPQHALAKKQMRGAGGMVSFIVKGGRDAGRQMMDRVNLWTLAVSLGDVDSLIEHPASMTHSTYNEEDLAKSGIVPGLVRLSVGLEDPEDLVDDLKQALSPLVRG